MESPPEKGTGALRHPPSSGKQRRPEDNSREEFAQPCTQELTRPLRGGGSSGRQYILSGAPVHHVCGAGPTRVQYMPQGYVHYARVTCTICGRFLRWLPSPRSIELRKLNAAMLRKLLAAESLTKWEQGFVERLSASLSRGKRFSPRQEAWLGRVYRRYFGGPAT